jgi:GAF domain-containing protein
MATSSSAAAVAHGVASSLSLPLAVGGRSVGALNLYSDVERGLESVVDDLGTIFASQVAVAISAATIQDRTRTLVAELEEALRTRQMIGQAQGILMATHRITSENAFTMLRESSQHSNRKLRDIANDVVATGALPEK